MVALTQTQLRKIVERALKTGFEVAERDAWISEWDGWYVTRPTIDWDSARKALDAITSDDMKMSDLMMSPLDGESESEE